MERVTFLIERTGERVSCLLNPESLEARRSAGLARRRQAGGGLLGNPRSDDPLIPTGGGITEYDLQLLFDVEVANEGRQQRRPITPIQALPPAPEPPEPPAPEPSGPEPDGSDVAVALADDGVTGDSAEPAAPAPPDPLAPVTAVPEVTLPELPPPDPARVIDVRELTQPLWALAETGSPVDGALLPQRIRFIWGKSWNVPGVVLAVAERLERFDGDGVPQRSWLSLRLRRVEDSGADLSAAPPSAPSDPQFSNGLTGPDGGDAGFGSVAIPVDPGGIAALRSDLAATRHYGDPALAAAWCEFNDRDDMLRGEEGLRMQVPPRALLEAIRDSIAA